MRHALRLMALLCVVILASGLVLSQTNTGIIVGTVKDQSGAVVPNAKVTAVNSETGATRTSTSDANGGYTVNALLPGTYQVTTEAGGFAANKQAVAVTVGSRNTLDIVLGVAGSNPTVVEVIGEGGATVNTTDQQVSSVVNSEQMTQLPTLTRNPYALVATAANVQQDSQAGMGDGRGAGFAINGQRSASTDVLLDGAENVDQFSATIGQTVPLDSVQEFRVITNGMTAEYGRAAGGVVSVATKSGTNQIHGSAYEFNRISALSSNTYDNAANGVKKPVFTRNQFGGSVGGPIIKNKLFFFDNAEWVRVRSSAPQISDVLDPSFIALTNANTQAFYSAYGKLRPDAHQIGSIPISGLGITPGARLGALPANTTVFDTVTYNAPSDAGGGAPQNTLMDVARVDLNISDKTQLFGRYSYYNEDDFAGFVNTSPYAGYETGQTNKDQNAMLSVTHTFSPRFLSNTRLVWSRLNNVQPLGTAPVGPTLYMRNNTTVRVGGHNVAMPGYNEYTPGNAIPFGGPQNLAQVYEDLNIVRGVHTLRFGGQYIYTQDNRAFGAYEEAVEALGTSTSGAYENLLAGNLASFQAAIYPQGKYPCPKNLATGATIVSASCSVTLPVGPPAFSRSNLYNDMAFYGQDTWKVTPRLTLDLGLRWEYYGVQHNRNPNLDSNFYYGTGNTYWNQINTGFVTTAPQSPIGSLWKPRYGDLGPRFGFAYDVMGDGKTALRGGYGISYERNFNNVTYNVIQNPPNYAVISITPADVGPIPVTPNNAGPLAGSVGTKAISATSLRNVDENIKTAYVEQYNLTLERQLNPNLVASMGYNGARGIHQYSISNINEPGFAPLYLGDTVNLRLNPQYTNINNRGSLGDSWYNAAVLQLRGRVKSLQTTATYTYSHSIDTLSSTFSDELTNNGLGYVNPFNPGMDKGSSDYDARHRISISMLYDLPFSKSQNALLRNTLGGFELAPIFTYRTGYPYTIFDCTNSASVYNCPRADVASGVAIPTSGSPGADQGGNLYNYMTFPGLAGDYAGPAVIPGTTTAFPITASNLPTCTGLYGQGCSFPSNMVRRNSSVGPGNWNWDMGVYKNFKVTERVNIQLRGEWYDVLNHKNFYILGFLAGGADISATPTTAAGVPIIQAKKGGYGNPFDDHRNTQLALRVTF